MQLAHSSSSLSAGPILRTDSGLYTLAILLKPIAVMEPKNAYYK